MKNLKIFFVSLSYLLLITLTGCSSGSEQVPEGESVKVAPAHKIHTVEIKDMKFIPEEVVVSAGDRVVFVNRDLVDHDVTEESKKEWSSSRLQTEKYWSLVVTVSQNYYCSLHPVMKGRILVK